MLAPPPTGNPGSAPSISFVQVIQSIYCMSVITTFGVIFKMACQNAFVLQEMATREMSKSSMRMTYSGIGSRDDTDSGYQVRRTEDVFHQQVNERVMNGIFSSKHFLVWCLRCEYV